MAATVDYEGNAHNEWAVFPNFTDGTYTYVLQNDEVPLPRYNVQTGSLITIPEYEKTIDYLTFHLREFKVEAPTDDYFYGTVNFYVSFYFALDEGTGVTWQNYIHDVGNDNFIIDVVDSRGTELRTFNKVSYFTPDSSIYPSNSDGFTMQFTVDVPQETPYISINMHRNGFAFARAYGAGRNRARLVIPSATLLLERSSEETKAIEEVADIIIEQNNISNEFYSNVINKVDQIYSEVNNVQTLQQEVINRMDEFNNITSIPSETVDKTQQAAQLITGLEGLEKPAPDQIVPDITVDTTQFADAIAPIFQNALIMQILLMSLGFAFVSYVLYGKK